MRGMPDTPNAPNFQHWRRRLRDSALPAYQLIPELLAEDLQSGRLTPRDRLPTFRELAVQLDLNYTTVVRAFAEARRRGLIIARPGLGTFVRGSFVGLPLRAGTSAEMTMNMPPEIEDEALLQRLKDSAGQALGQATSLHELLRYQDFGGTAHERALAAHWLGQWLDRPPVTEVLCCPGIHSVLTALMPLLIRPGQVLCVEPLAYPGLKAIATHLNIRLHPLQSDASGVLPRSFDDACRAVPVGAICLCPTNQNPTTVTMPIRRREAIAEIALRHSIPIIEDDAYGMLPNAVPPPLAEMAPELTYYLSGLSKCLGAGLRAAFVRAPGEAAARRLAGALRSITVMGSPLASAVVSTWLENGLALEAVRALREECAWRSAALSTVFGRMATSRGLRIQPQGFHAWIEIGGVQGQASRLAAHLRRQGLPAVAAPAFSTDRTPPEALRICLGGSLTREDCRKAISLLAEVMVRPQIELPAEADPPPISARSS